MGRKGQYCAKEYSGVTSLTPPPPPPSSPPLQPPTPPPSSQFVDAHTLSLTDKKGKVSQITSSRFIIATGGRPSPLNCEGGELAISSDDIFSLEQNPGKTLCVGASYIALECAGFLAGIGVDTEVAVRSILLRGFDREIADKIGAHILGWYEGRLRHGLCSDWKVG